jgi:two-component system phosphate regulon sensor histidine kinase PhoR
VDKEGRIQFVNPAACTLLGLHPLKSRGVKLWDAITQPEFARAFARLIKESGPDRREQVVVFADHRAFVAQMNAVRGTEGRLVGAVAVLRDMTSISKIEEDMTAVVTRMSQELKKPLTSIKGYVETLLEGAYNDPAINRRFLQVINEETNRMARLLMGIIDASGGAPPPSAERRPVALDALVRQAAEKLAPFARQKSVQLDLEVDAGVPSVVGDEALLSQAVTNLLDNALKFSGLPGQSEVPRVLVTLRSVEGRAVLEIQDNGVGIPAAEQARIFERFYRVADGPAAELGGTGLGLSIANEIVTGAGGRIQVRSQPGQGSTFSILF